jgi:hypothetical protein
MRASAEGGRGTITSGFFGCQGKGLATSVALVYQTQKPISVSSRRIIRISNDILCNAEK